MIKIHNLTIQVGDFSKTYNDIYIPEATALMVTGDNGCGKTMLLNSICGLIEHKTGYVNIKDKHVKDDAWKGFTGCFLGRDYLIPYLTPSEYFKLVLLMGNKQIPFNQGLIKKYSDLLFFKDFDKKIRKLSLGNQKKVGLIATLIADPELLIWDEPFANLDKNTVENLNKIMAELVERKKTIVFTNHPNNSLAYHNMKYEI